jgi:hypothetical protein
MKAVTASDLSLNQVELLDLASTSGNSGLWNGAIGGTSTGAALTQGTATVLDFKIARRYRGGKPRTYLPSGRAADQNDLNTWTSTYQSAVDSAWTAFIAAVLAIGGTGITLTQHVNVSYHTGGAIRPTPVVDNITAYSMALRISSQRRRIPRS